MNEKTVTIRSDEEKFVATLTIGTEDIEGLGENVADALRDLADSVDDFERNGGIVA